jgi:hypothetical protein
LGEAYESWRLTLSSTFNLDFSIIQDETSILLRFENDNGEQTMIFSPEEWPFGEMTVS